MQANQVTTRQLMTAAVIPQTQAQAYSYATPVPTSRVITQNPAHNYSSTASRLARSQRSSKTLTTVNPVVVSNRSPGRVVSSTVVNPILSTEPSRTIVPPNGINEREYQRSY